MRQDKRAPSCKRRHSASNRTSTSGRAVPASIMPKEKRAALHPCTSVSSPSRMNSAGAKRVVLLAFPQRSLGAVRLRRSAAFSPHRHRCTGGKRRMPSASLPHCAPGQSAHAWSVHDRRGDAGIRCRACRSSSVACAPWLARPLAPPPSHGRRRRQGQIGAGDGNM